MSIFSNGYIDWQIYQNKTHLISVLMQKNRVNVSKRNRQSVMLTELQLTQLLKQQNLMHFLLLLATILTCSYCWMSQHLLRQRYFLLILEEKELPSSCIRRTLMELGKIMYCSFTLFQFVTLHKNCLGKAKYCYQKCCKMKETVTQKLLALLKVAKYPKLKYPRQE